MEIDRYRLNNYNLLCLIFHVLCFKILKNFKANN